MHVLFCAGRALLLTLFAPGGAHAAPPALLMVNTIYPPFINPPGHPSGEGIDVEIAREALQRGGGYTVELQLLPWKRALRLLELGEADFTTTISRSGARDKFLGWSQGYRTAGDYRFYSRKGSGLLLTDLQGLKGKRLGVIAGFVYPPLVLRDAGAVIETARDITAAFQMLLAGRTDYIVVTAIAGLWEIRERGFKDWLDKQPFEHASDSPNYMAFSLARKPAAALAAMEAGLASMRRDGSIGRIERKYLAP